MNTENDRDLLNIAGAIPVMNADKRPWARGMRGVVGLYFVAGTSIQDVAEEAIRVSRATSLTVYFDYNGITWQVTPDITQEVLLKSMRDAFEIAWAVK
jgi:hypothetical protein